MFRAIVAAALINISGLPVVAEAVSDLVVNDAQGGVLAFLSGPIDMRHVEQLKEAILDHSWSDPFYLVLDSNGGDVEAGLALGRKMRDLGIYGSVPEDAVCLSSCALALFGAQERILLGTVGLHRPYYLVSAGASQPTGAEIQALYDDVEAYLDEMQVPRNIFEELMRIEPEDMELFHRIGDTHEIASIMPRNDPVYAERRANLQAARYGMDSATYRAAMIDVNARCSEDGTDADIQALGFVLCQMATFYDVDELEAMARMQKASQACAIPEEDQQEAEILYYILLSDYFAGQQDEDYDLNRYFFYATHETQIVKDACYRDIMSGRK